VRFGPVDFCVMDAPVFHSDGSPTFDFAPIAGAILLAKASQFPDTSTSGDDLDVGNPADNLEVHAVS
jgi:hypothetical protein